MCLICAQIYTADNWSTDPRDSESERTAGGSASLHRYQETNRRLNIINNLISRTPLKIESNGTGGYVISDKKGKNFRADNINQLWQLIDSKYGIVIDVLDL